MALTDNLVAYWKLDESSGNAADSVGSYTLTNSNVTYAAGKINNGAVFNGTSDKLENTSPFTITGTANFTFSLWAKVDTYQNQNVFTYDINGTNKIQIQPYSGHVYFQRGNEYADITGITDTTNWQHWVITYDGTNIRSYINSALQGSPVASSASYTASSPTFKIGCAADDSGDFDGNVDEFGYWSRALTPTEITTLYNSGAGLQYPFGETNTGNFFLLF